MSASIELEATFKAMRFSQKSHLGLGDIRVTYGQQEEILLTIAQLEAKLEAMLCGECEKSMLHCTCDT